MSDTCGPMSGTPLAQYDPSERCWKTSEATSLWALTLSSLTLPTWGGLHDGELFEHPTPERLTTEPGYSSLPTPVADNSRGLPNGGDYQSLPKTVVNLPTPKAADGERGRDLPRLRPDSRSRELATALLPTPAVNDMGAGKEPQAWEAWTERMKEAHGNGNGHGKSLEQEALKAGAITQPPSNDGSSSSGDSHQPQLFNEQGVTA